MSEDARDLFDALRTGGGDVVSGPRLVAVETDDPDVLERWRTADEDVPRQVVTAFRPRILAPDSYPERLPFVPGVRVYVTEMDDRPDQPGARWVVEDQSDVLGEVLGALTRDGWVQEPARELGFDFAGRRIVVRREDEARLLLEGRLDDRRRVVQLLALV